MARGGSKLITRNKKAYHDFHIEETLEAGLVLTGTEVKSLRDGRANLRDAYAVVRDEEAYLVGAHISPYTQGNIHNHEPRRDRKLLLHKHQIRRLMGKTQQSGYTIVPTKMYFSEGKAKVELGLAKGKQLHDKRRAIAKKQADREMERALKERHR